MFINARIWQINTDYKATVFARHLLLIWSLTISTNLPNLIQGEEPWTNDFWFRSVIKGEFSQPWSLRRPSNSSSVRKFTMIVVKITYISHFEFSYLNAACKPRNIDESSKWEQWNLYNVDKCHKTPSCGLLSCWAYSRQVRSDQSLLVKNLINSATHGRPKEAPNP